MDSSVSVGEVSLLTAPEGSDSGCNEILKDPVAHTAALNSVQGAWDYVYKCPWHGSLGKTTVLFNSTCSAIDFFPIYDRLV